MADIREGALDNPIGRHITIEVFGQPYTFKADADYQKAREVADYFIEEVNRVEMQLSHKTAKATQNAILILAALNIANENFDLKRDHARSIRSICDRSAQLLQTLDSHLQ